MTQTASQGKPTIGEPEYHAPPMAQTPSPRAPLIRARGLTKRFGDFTAVDAVDFDVQQGEAFGFLGPNGAGKTSTMRMIGCVSPKSDGELSVLGMDPATQGPRIRARIGVVPQEDTLDAPKPAAAPTSFSSSSSSRNARHRPLSRCPAA